MNIRNQSLTFQTRGRLEVRDATTGQILAELGDSQAGDSSLKQIRIITEDEAPIFEPAVMANLVNRALMQTTRSDVEMMKRIRRLTTLSSSTPVRVKGQRSYGQAFVAEAVRLARTPNKENARLLHAIFQAHGMLDRTYLNRLRVLDWLQAPDLITLDAVRDPKLFAQAIAQALSRFPTETEANQKARTAVLQQTLQLNRLRLLNWLQASDLITLDVVRDPKLFGQAVAQALSRFPTKTEANQKARTAVLEQALQKIRQLDDAYRTSVIEEVRRIGQSNLAKRSTEMNQSVKKSGSTSLLVSMPIPFAVALADRLPGFVVIGLVAFGIVSLLVIPVLRVIRHWKPAAKETASAKKLDQLSDVTVSVFKAVDGGNAPLAAAIINSELLGALPKANWNDLGRASVEEKDSVQRKWTALLTGREDRQEDAFAESVATRLRAALRGQRLSLARVQQMVLMSLTVGSTTRSIVLGEHQPQSKYIYAPVLDENIGEQELEAMLVQLDQQQRLDKKRVQVLVIATSNDARKKIADVMRAKQLQLDVVTDTNVLGKRDNEVGLVVSQLEPIFQKNKVQLIDATLNLIVPNRNLAIFKEDSTIHFNLMVLQLVNNILQATVIEHQTVERALDFAKLVQIHA
jgi:hypothetical protein